MSKDGTKLLFEGYLQKRKDTMKIKWATYWFRLQNTTLFFYTKKNGSASHLRGNYYIYTMQTVREIQKADSRRFMFEIIMTNGKRKMLAAETAALRQQWIGYLWQAMHLSTSGVLNSRNTQLEVRDRIKSSLPVSSHSDSVTESLPARPLSAPVPAPVNHIDHQIISPNFLSEELNREITYENTLPACSYQQHSGDSLNSPHCSSEWSNEERQEGDYDVLPIRNKICEISASTETVEDVYDVPVSCRRAAEHPESIYDVPSALLRMLPDSASACSSEEQEEDSIYWRI
ncbi:hypothetical protein D5F01_LYC18499 [Larimichthys crocea]|uniref:Arf-GAP with coiled-coil, ANK repeat and PH domain-containing protein n=1 Tax=Larimichthys crocea TaxID=215358 RepID=A0A6G0HV93_LARCR|nr:hypothetical protein D5F01_LYC18499 [Larimichthys crocea]